VRDEELLAAQRRLARDEGVFCEPASAISVAGLLKYGVPQGSTIVCVLTGNGLKDPDIVVKSASAPVVLDATIDALRGHLAPNA
jgi:threonine synthase